MQFFKMYYLIETSFIIQYVLNPNAAIPYLKQAVEVSLCLFKFLSCFGFCFFPALLYFFTGDNPVPSR